MTYDIETRLRAHLTTLGWDQRDILSAVRHASGATNLGAAERMADEWRESTPQGPSRLST